MPPDPQKLFTKINIFLKKLTVNSYLFFVQCVLCVCVCVCFLDEKFKCQLSLWSRQATNNKINSEEVLLQKKKYKTTKKKLIGYQAKEGWEDMSGRLYCAPLSRRCATLPPAYAAAHIATHMQLSQQIQQNKINKFKKNSITN